MQVLYIYRICFEATGISVDAFDFYIHLLEQFDLQVYIDDVGDVVNGNFLSG